MTQLACLANFLWSDFWICTEIFLSPGECIQRINLEWLHLQSEKLRQMKPADEIEADMIFWSPGTRSFARNGAGKVSPPPPSQTKELVPN